MAVRIVCPKCSASFQAPEELAGKAVRCRKCEHTFVSPTAEVHELNPAAPKKAGQWQPVAPAETAAGKATPNSNSKIGLILLLAGGALAALLFAGLIGVIAIVWAATRTSAEPEAGGSGPAMQFANEVENQLQKPEPPPPDVAKPAADPPAPMPPGPAAGNGNLSREKIEAMKRLTVFVNATTRLGKAQGSGFLFAARGGQGYIATNDHVVFGEALPASGTRLSADVNDVKVTVTFQSGSAEERTFPAEVIASDPLNDLAILRITADIKAEPLNIQLKTDLYETQPVFVFGFPLGSKLGGGRNPAITVGKGSVSSLRRDKQNHLMLVQLQGDVNPGNSGGPVVDDVGRFLGVVVAKVNNSQIGFAIPADRLRAMLNGATGLPHFAVVGNSDPMRIKISIDLIDPFDKIKSVRFHYVSGDHEAKDDFDGPFPPLANGQEVSLQKVGRTYMGTITVRRRDLAGGTLTGQAQFTFADGGPITFGRPFSYKVRAREIVAGAGRQRPPMIAPPRRGRVGNQPEPPAPPPDAIALESQTVDLPCPATDVAVGGDGRYLILRLSKENKIGVFDLKERKIAKLIPAPDEEYLVGASRDKLFLALTASNLIQRYSLTTFEREKIARIPFTEKPVHLAVGSGSTGPLAFATEITLGQRSAERVPGVHFVDATTLKEKPISIPEESRHQVLGLPGYPPDLRISANGKIVALWTPRISPSGMTILTLNNYIAKVQSERDTVGVVVPDAIGKFFYTQTGVFTANLKRIGLKPTRLVDEVPAINGPFFASLDWGDERFPILNHDYAPLVRIKSPGAGHVLLTLKEIDGLEGDESRFNKSGLPYDKRLFLHQDFKTLVTIPLSADRLIVHQFDIVKSLEKSNANYLLITSVPETNARRGKPYRYAIVAKARMGGITYKLEAAPKGMTISSEGKISWNVPDNFKDREVAVAVSVRDAGGTEALHTFTIEVGR